MFHVRLSQLLPGALLTLGVMHVLWWEGRRSACVALAVGSLIAVAPIVVYGIREFAPTSAEIFAEAQRVLVDFRLPHHALMSQWFDWTAGLQIAWISGGIILVRKSRLFPG